MEIETYIRREKELYTAILDFIDLESDYECQFQELFDIIDDQKIAKNQYLITELFRLLYIIGDNHCRTANFFEKLGLIFQHLTKNQPLPINKTEIINIYIANKRLLLLLFEYKVIIPDESVFKYLTDKNLYYYLFPGIKDYLNKEKKKIIEEEITQMFNVNIKEFESKCRKGENDSEICQLIRQDSIQEFVTYVNQTNYYLLSKVKPDFYESNPFLNEHKPSLIEYAFFYGSTQVIKYLQNNLVEITPKCWLYAIHSNNPEIIEILEENKIYSKSKLYQKCVIESIKCHHNDIANYFKEKLGNESYTDINLCEVKFYNFYYYPDDIKYMISYPDKIILRNYLTPLLSYITIPPSVVSIGNYAFDGCSSLKKISIPSSITNIGDYAFHSCSSLENISIPSSVTNIGDYAFHGCSSLVNISIPSSITNIGNYTFYGCSSLEKISIPSSITNIGNYAFHGCSSLTQISFEIPSSVTEIGNYAFKGCSSLTQISIPSFVTKIGHHTFYGCSLLTQITIPSSVTSIEESTFNGCSSLTQISFEIPSSVIEIRNEAFCKCSSLTQISIPSSVTKIGHHAFKECSSLTQISIPPSVTLIGSYAFYRCSSLKQIFIPSKINSQNLGIDSRVKINMI